MPDFVAQLIEKGGLTLVIGLLVWLLVRSEKKNDTLQALLNEVQNARINAVAEIVKAMEGNTMALEALREALRSRIDRR
jgi:hypothetical protein